MKLAVSLLILSCLFCSCSRREGEGTAAADFHTTSPEKKASFQADFQAFLSKNGFTVCPEPASFLQGGVYSSGEQSVWFQGSFHGSAPFFVRYHFQDAPESFDAHAMTKWEVNGSSREISAMKDAVRQFSAELEKIAARHR